MDGVHYSSKSPVWATPQWFFDALHREFSLTVDVCADADNHKLPDYYDEARDGLAQDWSASRCWMNPPPMVVLSKSG